MNVFLLFPDQDFDPSSPLLPQAAALEQDLELTVLLKHIGAQDDFAREMSRLILLSPQPNLETLRYRQAILRDCLENEAIVREMYAIPQEALRQKQEHWMGIFTRHPSGILSGAVDMLQLFFSLLRRLRRLTEQQTQNFHSPGFRRLFSMLQTELSDAYFDEVEAHLRELRLPDGVWLNALPGAGLEPAEYVFCRPPHASGDWLKRMLAQKLPLFSFEISPDGDAESRALADLRDRGLNLAANAAAQAADHLNDFLLTLRRELAFYIGALNLARALRQRENAISLPRLYPVEEQRLNFTGLYDAALALTLEKTITGNDLEASAKKLIFVTGANQGGKSTFLRSLGQAQLMAGCGLFVAAQNASLSLASDVFTHYRREEDKTLNSGKLEEELKRMSALLEQLRPGAMILFNESFAATNEREGSEIARQIVDVLLQNGLTIVFVTHQYELARGYYEQALPQAVFLRAERLPDGQRTFRMTPGEPLRSSFGEDIYRKIFAP